MNYVTVDETNKECPCVNCMWNVSKQNKLSNTVTAISWHCHTAAGGKVYVEQISADPDAVSSSRNQWRGWFLVVAANG